MSVFTDYLSRVNVDRTAMDKYNEIGVAEAPSIDSDNRNKYQAPTLNLLRSNNRDRWGLVGSCTSNGRVWPVTIIHREL